MAIKLRVEEVILNEETKNSFKNSIKKEDVINTELVEWFNENVWRMVDKYYQRLYCWEIWQLFTEETDKSLEKFNEYLETVPHPKETSEGIRDTNNAQEWLDIYYPLEGEEGKSNWGTTVRTKPRYAMKELFLDENKVIAKTEKSMSSSLFHTVGSGENKKKVYDGLRGDLDLSDFEDLEELTLCHNPFLGKVDISKCSKLQTLFISSNPVAPEKMSLENLIIADNYPNLKIVYYPFTIKHNSTYNKLVEENRTIIGTAGWKLDTRIKWIREEVDGSGNITRYWNFPTFHKHLEQELVELFNDFEICSSDYDFNNYKDEYLEFADYIGGYYHRNINESEDSYGRPKTGEDGNPRKVSVGNLKYRSKLREAIEKPLKDPRFKSWSDFREYLNEEFLRPNPNFPDKIANNFKKYFPNIPQNQAQDFIDAVIDSIRATENGENPDTSHFYLFPAEKRMIEGQRRGKMISKTILTPMKRSVYTYWEHGKKKELIGKEGDIKKVPFQELIPYEDKFKYGRK